jgi:hypothetical protein
MSQFDVGLPESANFSSYFAFIGRYLPVDQLPSYLFALVLLLFVVISIILVYHWRTYGRGFVIFATASSVYFIGAATIIWFAALLLGAHYLLK